MVDGYIQRVGFASKTDSTLQVHIAHDMYSHKKSAPPLAGHPASLHLMGANYLTVLTIFSNAWG